MDISIKNSTWSGLLILSLHCTFENEKLKHQVELIVINQTVHVSCCKFEMV